MAFKDSLTLKRAVAALSVFFAFIYFPLVVIFVCARVLSPGLDQTPDRIMPVMAYLLTDAAKMPWMAGILVAAPFAAAMSTVDSFMLMISSSVVRDVYQREINPEASERIIRRMSYACTLLIGVVALVGAADPPKFLQYVVVFAGGGLAAAFLVPVSLALYWRRFGKVGAMWSQAVGVASYIGLYAAGFIQTGTTTPIRPLGFDPLIWAILGSVVAALLATRVAAPPPPDLVRRYFGKD